MIVSLRLAMSAHKLIYSTSSSWCISRPDLRESLAGDMLRRHSGGGRWRHGFALGHGQQLRKT
jgi:hypothetical protein